MLILPLLAGALPGTAQVRSIDALAVTALPAPDFDRADAEKMSAGSATLKRLSSRPNKITDEEEWFRRNGLALERFDLDGLPPGIPGTFRDARLVQALYGSESYLLLYGKDFAGARYVVGMAKDGAFLYAFDFASFLDAPGVKTDELNEQPVTWAAEKDGVLYVANGHRTYASASKGKNAYLTAIDLKSGKILWRSRPLVANALNFAVVGDLIVSGYGFTKEPDFLYLIDRKTGNVIGTHPLKSGPDYILEKDGRLYVRTYNTDDVFEIRR